MWIWLMISCRTNTDKENCSLFDSDGDGFTLNDGDCNDLNAAIYPTAEDICDGMDNDCDGITDNGEDCLLYTKDAKIHFSSDHSSPMGTGGILGDITGDGEVDMISHSFLVRDDFSGDSEIHIFAGPFVEEQSTAQSLPQSKATQRKTCSRPRCPRLDHPPIWRSSWCPP